MDNVKKFEDFLDRMQGLLDEAKRQGHIIVRVEDLEKAFPELAESEDERIRKELIDFLWKEHELERKSGTKHPFFLNAIDWVERQKGKDALIKELGEYIDYVHYDCDYNCLLYETCDNSNEIINILNQMEERL